MREHSSGVEIVLCHSTAVRVALKLKCVFASRDPGCVQHDEIVRVDPYHCAVHIWQNHSEFNHSPAKLMSLSRIGKAVR